MSDQVRISTTARRIARAHNQHLTQAHSGGLLAFGADGSGGEWYSAGSRPPADLVLGVRHRRVTAREIQQWLDDQEEA